MVNLEKTWLDFIIHNLFSGELASVKKLLSEVNDNN